MSQATARLAHKEDAFCVLQLPYISGSNKRVIKLGNKHPKSSVREQSHSVQAGDRAEVDRGLVDLDQPCRQE